MVYHKNYWLNSQIFPSQKYLQKYNHLQPPDMAGFRHGGRNY